METRKVIHGAKYDIVSGADLSAEIDLLFNESNVFVITDTNTDKLLNKGCKAKNYGVKAGEKSKSISAIEAICDCMAISGCNRHTEVISLGGGMICDLAGFASAVFMRGVNIRHVPTTLAAMIDASIGGKTAVNTKHTRNGIGAFHQPSAVYISLHYLKTLPEREFLSGLGEMFKTALLDAEIYSIFMPFYETLKENSKKADFSFKSIVSDETFVLLVNKCIAFKLKTVTADEREKGLRKILNAGHTLGHALEVADNYRLSHGEYVAAGLSVEAEIMHMLNITQENHLKIIREVSDFLLRGRKIEFDAKKISEICAYDKKNHNGICIIASILPGQIKEVFLSGKELYGLLEKLRAPKKGNV